MNEKWGWYSTLFHLADEKIQNMEAITRLGIHDCLTFISYKQDEIETNNVNV